MLMVTLHHFMGINFEAFDQILDGNKSLAKGINSAFGFVNMHAVDSLFVVGAILVTRSVLKSLRR